MRRAARCMVTCTFVLPRRSACHTSASSFIPGSNSRASLPSARTSDLRVRATSTPATADGRLGSDADEADSSSNVAGAHALLPALARKGTGASAAAPRTRDLVRSHAQRAEPFAQRLRRMARGTPSGSAYRQRSKPVLLVLVLDDRMHRHLGARSRQTHRRFARSGAGT